MVYFRQLIFTSAEEVRYSSYSVCLCAKYLKIMNSF